MGNLLHEAEELRERYELLPDNAHSNALANAITIAGAHLLYGFLVNSTNAATQYILVFDLAALPQDGAVPAISVTIPATTSKGFAWLPPRKMLQGIVLCNSSTAAAKTIGAADCFFDVQYR